jgi:hypothetical protein
MAGIYLASRRQLVQPPTNRQDADDHADVSAAAITPTVQSSNDGSEAADGAAADVRAMSQTFRNATFLIAIRRAGYYCDDVVSATESADGAWVATCAGKGGYTIGVRAVDQFEVRPVVHYFDGVNRVIRLESPP